MPYVITTKRDIAHPARLMTEVVSRRAVATLEEARRLAADAVREHYPPRYPKQLMIRAARLLPESGGTVGPLPDGTVIEVKRVEWEQIADPHRPEQWPSKDLILADFNARAARHA